MTDLQSRYLDSLEDLGSRQLAYKALGLNKREGDIIHRKLAKEIKARAEDNLLEGAMAASRSLSNIGQGSIATKDQLKANTEVLDRIGLGKKVNIEDVTIAELPVIMFPTVGKTTPSPPIVIPDDLKD